MLLLNCKTLDTVLLSHSWSKGLGFRKNHKHLAQIWSFLPKPNLEIRNRTCLLSVAVLWAFVPSLIQAYRPCILTKEYDVSTFAGGHLWMMLCSCHVGTLLVREDSDGCWRRYVSPCCLSWHGLQHLCIGSVIIYSFTKAYNFSLKSLWIAWAVCCGYTNANAG